jgi:hypothetical protein
MLYTFQLRCPECGYRFTHLKIPISTCLEANLNELDQQRRTLYRDKLKEAFERNYMPSWAAATYKEQFGHWPPFIWALHCLYSEQPKNRDFKEYYGYLQAIAARKEKDEAWVQQQM